MGIRMPKQGPGGAEPQRWPQLARVAAQQEQDNAHEVDADAVAERAARPEGLTAAMAGAGGSGGQRLDDATRRHMGRFVETDLSQVRVHNDSRAHDLTRRTQAEAITVGRHIYFSSGTLRAGAMGSDRLLAHELAHVAQQSRTGVKAQAKLKLTGDAAKITRVITLINTNFSLFKASVSGTGEVTLTQPNSGPPTPEEAALARHLTTIIDDSTETVISVSSGSTTLVGSYATGDIDIADLETVGVGALVHELIEQFHKQKSATPFGSETSGAHGRGIDAESEVTGAKRGPQKMVSSTRNADGTIDATVEIPFTFPDGTVKTMELKIEHNNVKTKTWK